MARTVDCFNDEVALDSPEIFWRFQEVDEYRYIADLSGNDFFAYHTYTQDPFTSVTASGGSLTGSLNGTALGGTSLSTPFPYENTTNLAPDDEVSPPFSGGSGWIGGGTLVAGDYAIMSISCPSANTITAPSGWTTLVNSTGIGHRIFVAYRELDGTETSAGHVFTFDSPTTFMVQRRHVKNTSGLAWSTFSLSQTAAGFTKLDANSEILSFWYGDCPSGNGEVTGPSAWDTLTPNGWPAIEARDINWTQGCRRIDDQVAGSYASASGTVTTSPISAWANLVMEWSPATAFAGATQTFTSISQTSLARYLTHRNRSHGSTGLHPAVGSPSATNATLLATVEDGPTSVSVYEIDAGATSVVLTHETGLPFETPNTTFYGVDADKELVSVALVDQDTPQTFTTTTRSQWVHAARFGKTVPGTLTASNLVISDGIDITDLPDISGSNGIWALYPEESWSLSISDTGSTDAWLQVMKLQWIFGNADPYESEPNPFCHCSNQPRTYRRWLRHSTSVSLDTTTFNATNRQTWSGSWSEVVVDWSSFDVAWRFSGVSNVRNGATDWDSVRVVQIAGQTATITSQTAGSDAWTLTNTPENGGFSGARYAAWAIFNSAIGQTRLEAYADHLCPRLNRWRVGSVGMGS